jgi:hypothetical protein
MCNQPVGGYFSVNSLLVNGEPIDMPQRVTYVHAIAATATKAPGQVGVVYFASSVPGVGYPVTILDWDVREVDEGLFDKWLPAVFQRIRTLCIETNARTGGEGAGLWAQGSSGLCAALLQQGFSRGHLVTDIDEKIQWPPALADRAHIASRHIHTGKKVKITRAAHEKLATLRGVTRNHLLAQFHAFRAGEELESDELLNALVSGVLLAIDDAPATEVELSTLMVEGPASEIEPASPPVPHDWGRGFRVF